MKPVLSLLLSLFLATPGSWAQGPVYPVTASRITTGSGAPAAALCSTLANVGKIYIRKDSGIAQASLYICANNGTSQYSWERQGTASGSSETLGTTTNMLKLRSALDHAYNTPATIVFLGDSITQGSSATTFLTSWTADVMNALQRAYGVGGVGFCGANDTTANAGGCLVTLGGVWTAVYNFAPSLASTISTVRSNGASGTATTVFPPGGDTIDFYCATSTDSSAGFTVTIDGSSVAAACAANTGSLTMVKVAYTGLDPLQPHTIIATAPGSGNGYFFGFASRLSTGGVSMMNVSVSGSHTGNIAAAAQVAWLGVVPNLAAIVVALGQNESDKTGATAVTNLAAIATQAASLSVPIVYVLTGNDSSNNTVTWQPAIKSWASKNGYSWLSIADYWGTNAAATTLGLTADDPHPSQTGHYSMASLFLRQFSLIPPQDSNNVPRRRSLLAVLQPTGDVLCSHGGDTVIQLQTISAATNAAPPVFTITSSTGYFVGAKFTVSGVTPSAYNGTYTVTALDSTHLTASGSAPGSAYTSGGSAFITCSNAAASDATSRTNFATSYSLPSNLLQTLATERLTVEVNYQMWTPSASPENVDAAKLAWDGTLISGGGFQIAPPTSLSGIFTNVWSLTANGANLSTFPLVVGQPLGAFNSGSYSRGVQPTVVSLAGVHVIHPQLQYATHGILSGTYTSGITATGTVGQTCALSSFNNSNSGGTATVALTGTNTIAGGTALVITNTGVASASASTTATAGNGTATCSGTATVATVLGGSQGSAVQLLQMSIFREN